MLMQKGKQRDLSLYYDVVVGVQGVVQIKTNGFWLTPSLVKFHKGLRSIGHQLFIAFNFISFLLLDERCHKPVLDVESPDEYNVVLFLNSHALVTLGPHVDRRWIQADD